MDKKNTFILGGGPSLTEDIYKRIQKTNANIIAVNFSYKFAPPHIITFLDSDVYFKNRQELDELSGKGVRLVSKPFATYPSHIEQNTLYSGSPTVLSGIFAISWALANGYDNIYLFGYDGGGKDGKFHHHEFSREFDCFTQSNHQYEIFQKENIKIVGESLINLEKVGYDEVLV